MPNRLADETSPYLLQHANNPVAWRPWGPEALAKAKRENKPIFLSIGYSACHWCHVMEHESFEDEAIAAQLNAKFVCIKVDREERPDLDQIYMNAVQMITGRGGWPLSVFLTPDLQPFFGGTYWPARERMGMTGFDQVIQAVDEAWRTRRDQAVAQADEFTRRLQQVGADEGPPADLRTEWLDQAAAKLQQNFDPVYGGFGRAPKFPHSMDLQLLLRLWRRRPRRGLWDMVALTLDKMARGGIYDHLGGGFARYSVDQQWLMPHFEKMLYDNALLAEAYLDGFLLSGEKKFAQVASETLDYILAYMTDDQGGFHSTEDADSEGEEGKFYLWTPSEIRWILGAAADRFCYAYDVTETGNFEGKNILNLPKSIEQCAAVRNWDAAELASELGQSRAKLLAARDARVRPGKDDKVLAGWNGLAVQSLARAACVLGQAKYLHAATRAAQFVFRSMRRDDGRLLHCWRRGQAKLDAYLDDYAYLTVCADHAVRGRLRGALDRRGGAVGRHHDRRVSPIASGVGSSTPPMITNRSLHAKRTSTTAARPAATPPPRPLCGGSANSAAERTIWLRLERRSAWPPPSWSVSPPPPARCFPLRTWFAGPFRKSSCWATRMSRIRRRLCRSSGLATFPTV